MTDDGRRTTDDVEDVDDAVRHLAYSAAMTDLGQLYRSARERITTLVGGLDEASCERAVPATPGWTVHDVIAHLRGVVEDGVAGNMEGAPGDAWTSAQVARGRTTTTTDLLAAWAEQAPFLESVLSASNGDGMAVPAVIDVHTHELDLQGALGAGLSLPADAEEWIAEWLATGLVDRVAAAGLPPLRIVLSTSRDTSRDTTIVGDPAAPVSVGVSAIELFRSRLGRRSRDQVAAYDWSGGRAEPYLDTWFVFGPRPDPLVESPGRPPTSG